MRSLITVVVFLIFSSTHLMAQQSYNVELSEGVIHGTLILPELVEQPDLVIFISGSGPTNRDGNQLFMQNNAIRLMAEALAEKGVASYRFDKRGIGESDTGFDLKGAVLDDFIGDLDHIVAHFDATGRFSDIILAGHSEGALIALASSSAREGLIAKIILLAGPGRSLDVILKSQLDRNNLPGALYDECCSIIDGLVVGEKTSDVDKNLLALFSDDGQTFLMSMFRYDPAILIAQLTIPVLILQGGTDIQVSTLDADILKKNKPDAIKYVIADMNHVLKQSSTLSLLEQMETYGNPGMPLHPQLMPVVINFIERGASTGSYLSF